jgi:hypothetical protein
MPARKGSPRWKKNQCGLPERDLHLVAKKDYQDDNKEDEENIHQQICLDIVFPLVIKVT